MFLDEYQLDGCQGMKTIKLFNAHSIVIKSVSDATEIVDDWCSHVESLEISSLYALQRLYLPQTISKLKINYTTLKRIYNLKTCQLKQLILVNNSELVQRLDNIPSLETFGIAHCPFFSISDLSSLSPDHCTIIK